MNISFSMTTQQIRDRTKTVTRRLGWRTLKSGTVLMAIEKGQGLKKGEHVVQLGKIQVKSVRFEILAAISPADVAKEGFPGMTSLQFIIMFCEHNKCDSDDIVTRIEFEYL